MPESTSPPNYHIDAASATALLNLNKGHVASFYLYCDGSANKVGLAVVRATSTASLSAVERGKEQRKAMGVSQFARGILFCDGPQAFTFVRYGGSLAKVRMEYAIGVMRKRGRFDGRIIKGLRDAQVFDREELDAETDEGGSRLDALLATEEEPAPTGAPVVAVATEAPSTVVELSMSKAELLVAMELESLSAVSVGEELVENALEDAAPLLGLMGIPFPESGDLEEVVTALETILDSVDPELLLVVLQTEEGARYSKTIRETIASMKPLREAGGELVTRMTAKMGKLLGGRLEEVMGATPVSPDESATREVRVGYSGKTVSMLAAKLVARGARLPDGRAITHIKRAHARRLRDRVEEFDELVAELLDDDESSADDLLDELDDALLDARADVDRLLEDFAGADAAVIDEIALGDLQEALGELDASLEVHRGNREAIKLRAGTRLQDLTYHHLIFRGVKYGFLVSDADLRDVFMTDSDGAPKMVTAVPETLVREKIQEPLERLAATSRRAGPGSRALGVELEAAVAAIDAAFEEARNWKASRLVFRSAQATRIEALLATFGPISIAHERAIGERLEEYEGEAAAFAAAVPSGDPPLALRDIWARAVESAQTTLAPLRGGAPLRQIKVRLGPPPYPAQVWHEESPHKAHYTDKARAAAYTERGYSAALDGSFMSDKGGNIYVRVEGGAATLAAMKPLLGAAGFKQVYVVTDPDVLKNTFDAVEQITGKLKHSASRMVGRKEKYSAADQKILSSAARALRPALGTPASELATAGLPASGKDLTELAKRYAVYKGVDTKVERQRLMGIEALMDSPDTRDALIQAFRQRSGVENLAFYVAVVPSMARHRAHFPELLPMLGLRGVDRVTWLHQNYVLTASDHAINIAFTQRDALISRFNSQTFQASAHAEYQDALASLKTALNDAMSGVYNLMKSS